MTYIRVDPDELNVVSTQIHSTMNEMDQSVRNAYDQLRGIRDRARGLDDIRNRAAELYRHHTNQMQSAQQVQRHIQESAQRFSEHDRQLSSMLGNNINQTISTMLRFHSTVAIGGFVASQLLPTVFDTWNKYAANTWNTLQQRKEFEDLETMFDLLGGFKNFDKTNIGKTFSMLKGFIPDGRTTFGKFVDKVGGFGEYVGTAFTAVKVVDLLSTVYQDSQTGDYTNSIDKATSIGASVATTMIVKGLVKGALMVNPVVGVVVAGAFLAPKILTGAGYLASYMGFEGTGQALRNIGSKIDIEKAIENSVKWGLNKGVEAASSAWNKSKKTVQNSVNFVKDQVNAVSSWTKKLLPGWG